MNPLILASKRPLILASKSQARQRLLSEAGLDIICDPADLDETPLKTEMLGLGKSAPDAAILLAEAKAIDVSNRHAGRYIIGGDQILECEGEWFDKPKIQEGAIGHLKKLRGKAHFLHSAVSVVKDTRVLWSQTHSARLIMRSFSDKFIDDYLSKCDKSVYQSVGCYHLEGLGANLFESIEGDYFTVLGIPLLPLLNYLRNENIIENIQ